MSDPRFAAAARAAEIAVQPYAARTPGLWLGQLYDAVGQVLETERGYAALVLADGTEYRYRKHVPEATLTTYMEEFADTDPGRTVVCRAGGTYTSQFIWTLALPGEVEPYKASPLWNDYYVPHELDDGAGYFMPVAMAPGAFVYLNFGRREGRLYNDRDLALLRLLEPAVKAGVTELILGKASWELSLAATGAALLVLNATGRTVYRTPAASDAIATMPAPERGAWEELVRRDALRLLATGRRGSPPPAPSSALTVSRMTIVTNGAERLVLVRLLLPRSAVPAHLAQHLSASERRLVDALVGGATAREIAAQTGRSHDTVRRAIERLYAKLGIHRRAELVMRMGE